MTKDDTLVDQTIKEKVEDLAASIRGLAQSLDLQKEAGIDPADIQRLVSTLLQLKSMRELGLDGPTWETVEVIERMTAALDQAAAGHRKG